LVVVVKDMDELFQLHDRMRACRLCVEAGHAIVPGAIFSSGTERRVMLIGQAPGVTEVEAQRPFNATSGTRLFQWLGEAGWQEDDFRARHYMTAVTKCYPGKAANGKGDRVPSKAEQALCRPFLEQELALVNPRLVILVGGLAIKLFYPARLKLRDVVGTAVYQPPVGTQEPANLFDLSQAEPVFVDSKGQLRKGYPGNGRFIVPMPHPSGASLWPNKPENKALISRAVTILAAIRQTFIN
jgi:uracil-DNA glycosylase